MSFEFLTVHMCSSLLSSEGADSEGEVWLMCGNDVAFLPEQAQQQVLGVLGPVVDPGAQEPGRDVLLWNTHTHHTDGQWVQSQHLFFIFTPNSSSINLTIQGCYTAHHSSQQLQVMLVGEYLSFDFFFLNQIFCQGELSCVCVFVCPSHSHECDISETPSGKFQTFTLTSGWPDKIVVFKGQSHVFPNPFTKCELSTIWPKFLSG